jgi:hypothetical protein
MVSSATGISIRDSRGWDHYTTPFTRLRVRSSDNSLRGIANCLPQFRPACLEYLLASNTPATSVSCIDFLPLLLSRI